MERVSSPVRVRVLTIAAWTITTVAGFVALSQLTGVTGLPVVFVLQALTPVLLAPSVPLAVVATARGKHRLALTNAAIGIVLLWLTAPVVFHERAAALPAGSAQIGIAHANVYYGTTDADAVAARLLALDADLLAITEYSAAVEQALLDAGADDEYPFREAEASPDRNGIALWSRFPIDESTIAPIGHQAGIDATVDVAGTPLRVLVVHPLPGTDGAWLGRWADDLATIGDRALAGELPTVVVGDFNASRWHPAFRDLLERGFDDAHEVLGRGFSASWPDSGLLRPFVRIDHALLGDGVSARSVDDVEVPGSDHRGFVVQLAVAAG